MLKSNFPRMGYAVWAVAGLVLVTHSTTGIAASEAVHFRHLEWSGKAYFSKTSKSFSHCAMSATYKSGTMLGFAYFDTGLLIMLGNPKWELNEKEIYDITLAVDNVWTLRTKALPRTLSGGKAQVVDIHVGKSRKALQSLRTGRVLKVQTAANQLRYKLTGTMVALQKLDRCYRAHAPNLALSRSTNPFAGKSATSESRSKNPLSGRSSKKLQSGLPRLQNPQNRNEITELAKWSSRVSPIIDEFYRVLDFLIEAEDTAFAYTEGKVTKDYAERRSVSLVYQAQSTLTAAENKLQALPDPPKLSQRQNLGKDTKRFVGQLRDQIGTMLDETKKSVLAALSGDTKTHDALVKKGYSRYIILLRSEILLLDLQNAGLTKQSPQLYLNKSIKHGNEAIVQILTAILSASDKNRFVDLGNANSSAKHEINEMENAIEQGRNSVSQFESRLGAELVKKPRLRQPIRELMQLFEKSFDVEQNIASSISSIAHVFSDLLLAPAQQQDWGALSKKLDVAALEIEQFGKTRTDLIKRRLQIIGTTDFR